MEKELAGLVARNREHCACGAVANYIPGLERVDKNRLGISVGDIAGNMYAAGDPDVWFTAQSIAKIFVLAYLLHKGKGAEVSARIGLEPTGERFNSLKPLDLDGNRKPFNPMINAGAITATSLIPGTDAQDKLAGLLHFVGRILERSPLAIDETIYEAERQTGNKNWAIAYMLKENTIISSNLDETMRLYFAQCSILLCRADLVRFGIFLLREGVLRNGEALVTPRHCRLLKGVMLSCGLYTGSGSFAANVGIPAKSGVSGGIVAVSKNYGIGVYGPSLDSHGNSIAGVALLNDFVDTFSESLL